MGRENEQYTSVCEGELWIKRLDMYKKFVAVL